MEKRLGKGMAHGYFADVSWDGEAGVWSVSDTNVPGLAAEAPTHFALLEKIRALVPELYELNRSHFREPALEAILLRITFSRLETIRLAG